MMQIKFTCIYQETETIIRTYIGAGEHPSIVWYFELDVSIHPVSILVISRVKVVYSIWEHPTGLSIVDQPMVVVICWCNNEVHVRAAEQI